MPSTASLRCGTARAPAETVDRRARSRVCIGNERPIGRASGPWFRRSAGVPGRIGTRPAWPRRRGRFCPKAATSGRNLDREMVAASTEGAATPPASKRCSFWAKAVTPPFALIVCCARRGSILSKRLDVLGRPPRAASAGRCSRLESSGSGSLAFARGQTVAAPQTRQHSQPRGGRRLVRASGRQRVCWRAYDRRAELAV